MKYRDDDSEVLYTPEEASEAVLDSYYAGDEGIIDYEGITE